MATITTKDGATIFYKDWGPKNAQPIVFHHGWPLSSDDWDAQMLFFVANGYRVIAHDRPAPMGTAAKDAPAVPSAGTGANPANIDPGATSNESHGTTPASPRESSKFPMVTGIQHWSSADSSAVILNLEDEVQYEAHRTGQS